MLTLVTPYFPELCERIGYIRVKPKLIILIPDANFHLFNLTVDIYLIQQTQQTRPGVSPQLASMQLILNQMNAFQGALAAGMQQKQQHQQQQQQQQQHRPPQAGQQQFNQQGSCSRFCFMAIEC